eukprot:13464478-Alexandrium_andersonii.AAC.1
MPPVVVLSLPNATGDLARHGCCKPTSATPPSLPCARAQKNSTVGWLVWPGLHSIEAVPKRGA